MILNPGNPMTKVLVSVVAFEVIVFGLAIPGMIMVSNVPWQRAALWAGVSMAIALASAATLGRPFGFYLGWVAQVAGIMLGLLTPWMYVMGTVFALLWIGTFILGKRLDG